MMSPVFVMSPLGTFTPSRSGAIATVIWQCCRQAARESVEPVVIVKRCAAEPYPWRRTVFVDYPADPAGGLGLAARRLERRVAGWTYLGQRTYAANVARALEDGQWTSGTLILNNDPEMAVYLRSRFPQAFIVHQFHNVLQCKVEARRRFARSVDVVTGVSDFACRWAEEYFALPPGSARVVYNGVDLDEFSPAPRPPPGLPVLGYVGRTGIEKGPDIFLAAAVALSRRRQDFAVQMVGSNHWDRFELDEFQRKLLGLIDELKSRGVAVDTPGHVGRGRLPDEFRKAHIHVVPTRCQEAFGMSTLEGMASGLAVVASRTGGTPEVLGDAGLLFEKESVDELAGHLDELVSRPDLRAKYGKLARQRALLFSWDHAWKQWKELLPIR